MFVSRSKPKEQEAARELRADGLSLGAIANRLGVAKSSVSRWVRDVPLSDERRAVLDMRARRTPASLRPPRPALGASGVRRRCSGCREDLPIEAFNRNGDDHQWYCRECFKAYFRARGQKHRDQSGVAREARRSASRAYVLAYLETNPCVDCGCGDPVVLEFDHLRDKLRGVGALMQDGRFELLLDELDKCEVVCVNCHRRRTAVRGGHARATGRPRSSWSRRQRTSVPAVWRVLTDSGCVDCGERDLAVLDFDHQRDKRCSPISLAMRDRPWSEVEAEMAKCEVRCGSCHRRRTTVAAGWYRAAGLASVGPP